MQQVYLLSSTNTRAVVKELIGKEAFEQLQLLQKNAGRLQASLDKFYNFSKSGSTLADVGAASSMLTGIVRGNPYLIGIAGAKIGGLFLGAHLFADPEFLRYLREAAMTSNKDKFRVALRNMQPSVNRAIVKTSLEARE